MFGFFTQIILNLKHRVGGTLYLLTLTPAVKEMFVLQSDYPKS